MVTAILEEIFNTIKSCPWQFFSPYIFQYWKICEVGPITATQKNKLRLWKAKWTIQKPIVNWTRMEFEHCCCSCSVAKSYLILRDPHGLQHARLPCPSLSPGVCLNSRPLSRWCHPTISSSVVPFSSRLQSFPASGSFPVSWLFAWSGQSFGVSASAPVLPVNTQDWFPLRLTGCISLLSKGLQESPPAPQFKSINPLALSFLYSPTLTSIYDYWKNHSFD